MSYICFVVQLLSHVQLFVTPWTVAHHTPQSFTISCRLLNLFFIELIMLSVSTSATPFSFCLQSFSALGSFSMSQLFASGGQSIDASDSASVLLINSGMLSDSLWPHWLQNARPPCPLHTPVSGVHPSSCPLNWWCYLTISSSATLFSICLQSFPALESFPVGCLFAYWSFSFSISPSNEYSGLICIWSYHSK